MDVCKPNCKLCLRVWVPSVRKELLGIFSSIVFKSSVPSGRSGEELVPRSPCSGKAAAAAGVGPPAVSPRLGKENLQTTDTAEFSLSRAGESQQRRARGMGRSPAETWK